MNILFEFMSMILKNHMFEVDSKKMQVDFFYFLGCPKRQSRFQVNEILNVFTFLVNGHLKFTYAMSISKVKINFKNILM